MAISRMQQPRQMYGLGSLVKSAVKGVTSAVKSIAKSDLGKAALLIGGGMYAGGLGPFAAAGRFGSIPGAGFASGIPSLIKGGVKTLGLGVPAGGKPTLGQFGKVFALGSLGGAALEALTASGADEEELENIRDPETLRAYLRRGYKQLNPGAEPEQIEEFVTANTTEYAANGGRIGYNEGTDFQKWLEGKQKFEQGQNFEQLYREYLEDKRRQKVAEQKTMAANGGRIGYQIGGLSSLYGSNTGGQKPIYPRISDIEASLSGAEQRIGDPSLSSFGASSGGVSDGGFSSPMGEVYNQPTGGEQPNSSNVQTQIPRDPGGEMGMPGFYIPRYDLPKSVLINPIRQPGIQQPGIQQPVRPLSGIGGIQMPQADPNRDYGFNQYGFDSDLLNYLNQQMQGSFSDRGISYDYDPTNQMFSGGTFGAQYGNIPLSVLQQVASGDRNLLQQYQTGGRGAFGGGRGGAAYGGRIGYAFGNPEQNAINAAGIINLPLNQNPAGVTELDLRDSGGFIPPVGVKEKADDIPAMLSNNEFVFTAKSVRNMGDGDVNKGAQRMYDMMKYLEKGGRV
jgi:hypothetical protein